MVVIFCHEAGTIAGLEFWRTPEHSLAHAWEEAPGMLAFRGEAWMQEPCRSCERRAIDFGGCRCQAFHLTGDAAATDPACSLSPRHDVIVSAREEASGETGEWRYRGSSL